jgi:thiopeptide-type bacteriocin biosynthesis protein
MYERADFVVLCTPLLPVDAFTAWTGGLELEAALDHPLDPGAELDAVCRSLRERLAAAYSSSSLQQALTLASPLTAKGYCRWRRNPAGRREQVIERALVRHFTHASSHGLPGTAHTHSGHVAAPSVSPPPGAKVLRRIRYTPNPSLYKVGDQCRYVKWDGATSNVTWDVVGIDWSIALETVLSRARVGATVDELVERLQQVDPQISCDEAGLFVDELAASQVLVAVSQPHADGDPSQTCAGRHEKQDGMSLETSHQLVIVTQDANTVRPFGDATALADRSADVCLDGRVADEVVRGVALLRTFWSGNEQHSAIKRFVSAFVRRYEGREVPLVEALDEDFGIGFDDRIDPSASGRRRERQLGLGAKWRSLDRYLLTRLQLLDPAAEELEIREQEMPLDVPSDPPELSTPMRAHFAIDADSLRAIRDGCFRVRLDSVVAASAADVVASCRGHVERLCGYVAAEVQREQASDTSAVFAEIAPLSWSGAGAASHHRLREYEIVCVGHSSVPVENQIAVTDLMVSVNGGRVTLRSKRLDRRIKPVMTSMDRCGRNPAAYRFLLALQHHDAARYSFTWGPLDAVRSLPRVVSGKCVLAPAQWTIYRSECDDVAGCSLLSAARAFQDLRRRRRLPRFVVARGRTGPFLVDCENALSLKNLRHALGRREFLTLHECIPSPDRAVIRGPEGGYSGTLVLPLHIDGKKPSADHHAHVERPIRRMYVPGANWMFAKLYCGRGNVDRVLRKVVAHLVRNLIGTGIVDRWFFIRYGDPDWHIRLRVHGRPDVLAEAFLGRLRYFADALIDDGTIWKIQLDTYYREVERYGGPEAISAAEELFWIDSEAALDIISSNDRDDSDLRFSVALVGMRRWLDDLQCQPRDKTEICHALRAWLRRELGVERAPMESVISAQVLDRLDDVLAEGEWIEPYRQLIDRRSRRTRVVAHRLRTLADAGLLVHNIPTICRSFLHMHANRMLSHGAKRQELMLYECLARVCQPRADARR